MEGCNRINRQSPEGRAADVRDNFECKPVDTGKLGQEFDDSVEDEGGLELNIRDDTAVRQMLGAHLDDQTPALKGVWLETAVLRSQEQKGGSQDQNNKSSHATCLGTTTNATIAVRWSNWGPRQKGS